MERGAQSSRKVAERRCAERSWVIYSLEVAHASFQKREPQMKCEGNNAAERWL